MPEKAAKLLQARQELANDIRDQLAILLAGDKSSNPQSAKDRIHVTTGYDNISVEIYASSEDNPLIGYLDEESFYNARSGESLSDIMHETFSGSGTQDLSSRIKEVIDETVRKRALDMEGS